MSSSLPLSLDEQTISAEVRRLGPWFHNLDLGGVRTAPDHFLGDYPACKWRAFADALPADLTGKIERRYAGFPTNWWVPNRACLAAMLRSAGFRITAHPEAEVFVCQPRFPGEAGEAGEVSEEGR